MKRFGDRTSGNIFGYIAAFIACLLTFSFFSLLILLMTIVNRDYVKSAVSNSSYARLLKTEIDDQFAHLAKVSGVPQNVFEDLVSESDVKKSSEQYFERNLYSKDIAIDNDFLKNKLRSRLDEYVSKADTQGISDAELKKNINDLINETVAVYNDNIEVKFVPEFGGYFSAIGFLLSIGLVVIAAVDLMFFLLMLIIFRRTRRYLKHIIISLIASSIMLFTVPAAIAFSGIIERVAINSKALYTLVTELLRGFEYSFVFYGALVLFIAIILLIVRSVSFRNRESVSI